MIDSNDEGLATMWAWRVVRGEVPYRDFFTVVPPLSFYVLASVYKVFGVSFLAGRVVAQLIGVGLVALVVFLSRRLVPSPLFAAIPAAFLIQAGVGAWPFPSHHWFANLFSLAAILAALRSTTERPFLWGAVGGMAAALSIASLQDQGGYLFVGVSLAMAFSFDRQVRWKALGGWAAGGIAVAAPVAAWFAGVPGWSASWFDLVVFPATRYRAIPGNDYPWWHPFSEIAKQWMAGAWDRAPIFTIVTSVTSTSIVLVPIASLAVLFVAWRRGWLERGTLGILAAADAAFIATAAHRWAPINIQWAIPVPALVLAIGLHRLDASDDGRSRWRFAAAGIVGSFLWLALFQLVAGAKESGRFEIETPAGRVVTFDPREADAFRDLVGQIASKVPEGEPMLTIGWPTVNFLTGHPNPTRHDFFTPPYLPDPEQTREAISDLERKKVRWIATRPFQPGDTEWERWLVSRYDVAWGNQRWGLLRLRATAANAISDR